MRKSYLPYYYLPKAQQGGFNFDFLKGLVPQIQGYQGTNNGTSNLYSDDAQSYYNNLIGNNQTIASGQDNFGQYFGEDNPVTVSDMSSVNRLNDMMQQHFGGEGIPDFQNVEIPYQHYMDTQRNELAGLNYNEGDSLNFGNASDAKKYYDIQGNIDKFENKAQTQFNQDRSNAIGETGANIFSLIQGQSDFDKKPKDDLSVQNNGTQGFRYAQMGGSMSELGLEFNKMFDPNIAKVVEKYYIDKFHNPFSK